MNAPTRYLPALAILIAGPILIAKAAPSISASLFEAGLGAELRIALLLTLVVLISSLSLVALRPLSHLSQKRQPVSPKEKTAPRARGAVLKFLGAIHHQ